MLQKKERTDFTMATLNERTIARINFHSNRQLERLARLEKLTPGTPSHTRCEAGIKADFDLVVELKAQLAERIEAGKGNGPSYVPAKPRSPRTGVEFEVVVANDSEPEGDVEFEYAGNKGAPGHRFDLVG
jgi:hypothetical protein